MGGANESPGVARSVPLYDVGILSDSHPDISGPGNASLFIDSLHLSPEGGRLMAGIVARQLRLGDQASSPRAIGNE